MSEQVLFIHGKPGAGKSSCCRFIVETAASHHDSLPLRHLAVGSVFRAIAAGLVPSVFADELIAKPDVGNSMGLPPHELVFGVVSEQIARNKEPGITLVDGFPKEPEMLPLLQAAEQAGTIKIIGGLVIDLSDRIAIGRQLSRDSVDSHPDYDEAVAADRVQTFNDTTEPVIAAMAEQWPVVRIDGSGELPDVRRDFSDAVGIFLADY